MNLPLVVLLAPALGVLAMFFVPGDRPRAVRAIAVAATTISLLSAIALFVGFSAAPDPSTTRLPT